MGTRRPARPGVQYMNIRIPRVWYPVAFMLTMLGCAGTPPREASHAGADPGTGQSQRIDAEGATVQVRVSDEDVVRRVAIRVVPLPASSIPRRPGLSVHPRGSGDVAWTSPVPVRVTGPPGYFPSPPLAVVEYTGEAAIGLEVRYAYCVSESRCFLVRVPVDIDARPTP